MLLQGSVSDINMKSSLNEDIYDDDEDQEKESKAVKFEIVEFPNSPTQS